MAKIITFSIVCLSFFSGLGQAQHVPFTTNEADQRKDFTTHFTSPFEVHRWEIFEDTIDAWKRWDIVDNYEFGPDRGNIAMITDLQSLHPYFRDKVLELIRLCKLKGIELAIVETYRTPTKQNEFKAKGRKYTRVGPGRSKHQYGLAVDVVPVINSKPQWRNIALWRKVGVVGERLGMVWGGRWRRLFDPGHFEWTGGLDTYALAKGNFPTIPKGELYPCLEEDLKELQRHWKAWQIQQSEVARHLPRKNLEKSLSKSVSHDGGD
jgi:hypothetical protein